jgi:hypothetical protein
MRRINLAVVVLPLLLSTATLTLAAGGGGMGGGMGGGAGTSGTGASAGASAGASSSGAGNGAGGTKNWHVVSPTATAQASGPASDAVKDPLRVQTQPRSALLERPGRQ